jgi:hypothetical protein
MSSRNKSVFDVELKKADTLVAAFKHEADTTSASESASCVFILNTTTTFSKSLPFN